MRRMMAELFGRRDGTNGGKGGSMHIADFSVGMLGANGVVCAARSTKPTSSVRTATWPRRG